MLRLLCKFVSPFAALWIEQQESKIIAEGQPLPTDLQKWANLQGIENPSQIRVLRTPTIPLPAPNFVLSLIQLLGFPTHNTVGMCMNRGIFLRDNLKHKGQVEFILKHELIHTLQYQRLKSVRIFIEEYFYQCIKFGYSNASLELEAIKASTF